MRIGISGWRYAPWRGTFYPKGLPQHAELGFAANLLAAIEINGSFYSLQRPSSYALWYEQTPDDFMFSVKGARYITHMRRLNDVEKPLANFFASGIFNLREKLGPILWQFPPNFGFDERRMEGFLELLPDDTAAAAVLAPRSGYSDKSLRGWGERILEWHRGGEPHDALKVEKSRRPPRQRRDVFCFFDNTDMKLRAPFDAQNLADKLRVG